MMLQLAKNHAFYGYLLNRKGERTKAKEALCNAIEIFKECGADGWIDKYEKEMAQL
jgi:hypothetical protein